MIRVRPDDVGSRHPTLVNYETARRNSPEDSRVLTRYLENLKSHLFFSKPWLYLLYYITVHTEATYFGEIKSPSSGLRIGTVI
jgi:hypothetical protein